ncbi:MAG: hypothetical protein V1860_02055 [bacterium]
MKIKNQILYFVLTISLAIIVIAGFIILPTMRNIKDMSDKITELKVELEKKYDNRQTLRSEMNRYKKIDENIEKFLEIYVKENGQLLFITAIEDIAAKNNLDQKINMLDLAESPNKNKAGTQSNAYSSRINIHLKGGYADILKYLSDTRKISYYINIQSISISKLSEQKNYANKGSAEADILAYFFILK